MKIVYPRWLVTIFAVNLLNYPALSAPFGGSFSFDDSKAEHAFAYNAAKLKLVAVPEGKTEGDPDEQPVSITENRFTVDWIGPGKPAFLWSSSQMAFFTVYVVWPDQREAKLAANKGFKFSTIGNVRKDVLDDTQRFIESNKDDDWNQSAQTLEAYGQAMKRLTGLIAGKPIYVLRQGLIRQVSDNAMQFFLKSHERPSAVSVQVQRKWLYQRISGVEAYAAGDQRNYQFYITFAAMRDFATIGYFKVKNLGLYRLAKNVAAVPDTYFAGHLLSNYHQVPNTDGTIDASINTRKAFTEDIGEILLLLSTYHELADMIPQLLADSKAQSKWRIGKEPEKELASRRAALKTVSDLVANRSNPAVPLTQAEATSLAESLSIDSFYYFCNALYEVAAERIIVDR